jgi:hypothetical protein
MVDTPHIMSSTETDVRYSMWHKVNDPHGGYYTYHRFNGKLMLCGVSTMWIVDLVPH